MVWGVRDFEHRFGRRPEGMWLPETAVDLPTLEALAEQGIAFTILAPHQARAVRPAGDAGWADAREGLDTRRPYRCRLPSGRSIALFFYDGALARAVAFERLLASGEGFVSRLLSAFDGGGGAGPGPPRHRRRDLRPPPPPRRDGPRLGARISRRTGRPVRRRAHQLRAVPRRASARRRGRDRRGHLVELRPRHRTVAGRLRLPGRRRAGVEPGVAAAAARRPRLAARCRGAALRGGGADPPRRPLGGARRLRRGRPRPLGGAHGALLRPPPGETARAGRARPRRWTCSSSSATPC